MARKKDSTAKVRFHFKDDGQDIQWWEVDEKGFVLNCNLQGWVWNGTKVEMVSGKTIIPFVGQDPGKFDAGAMLLCTFKDGSIGKFIHPIEKVEALV